MSCQCKTGNETLPLIMNSAGKSQPINCTSAQSLVKIKSHTTHTSGSGTDANLDMRFKIRVKDNSQTVNDKCPSGVNCIACYFSNFNEFCYDFI